MEPYSWPQVFQYFIENKQENEKGRKLNADKLQIVADSCNVPRCSHATLAASRKKTRKYVNNLLHPSKG